MRIQRLTVMLLLVAPCTGSAGQKRWVILPERVAEQATHLCSREGAPKFEGTWTPTEEDIRAMESRFSGLTRLKTQGGMVGLQVKKPKKYYRQYVGILVGGRRLIYINALCRRPDKSWEQQIEDVCDGGCSWGALYDVVSGTFSDLQTNGIA